MVVSAWAFWVCSYRIQLLFKGCCGGHRNLCIFAELKIMTKKKKRVLVAMSGGIDSSVAAIKLHEAGYEVIGITMKTWHYQHGCSTKKQIGCCNLDTINDAREVAARIGFPYMVLDIRKTFGEHVIDHFVSEYVAGRTPNPCVLCNTHIKWDALRERADELGCDYLATGHYAQVKEEKGRYVFAYLVFLTPLVWRSAPCCTRYFRQSKCPSLALNSKGVSPCSFLSWILAPCCTRNFKQSRCPLLALQVNGVITQLSMVWMSAPCPARYCRQSRCPFLALSSTAVSPYLFLKLISAPCSTRYCRQSRYPLLALSRKAVSPYLFLKLTSAPCFTRYFRQSRCPFLALQVNAIIPQSSMLWISAPFSTRYFTQFARFWRPISVQDC